MWGQFLIILASILILGLVGTMDDAYAETLTTIFDGPWDSAGTWEDSMGDNYPPGEADDKIINHAVIMEVSESNSGEIQINGSLEIDDDVIGPITFTNTGNITINSGGSITIDPDSTIINDDSGTIRINSGGTLTNSGTVTLKGGFFDNQGTFSGNQLELNTLILNPLTIDGGGTIIISDHTRFFSLSGGVSTILTVGPLTFIEINSGVKFRLGSAHVIINSLGEIKNAGTIAIILSSVTINSGGKIINTGKLSGFIDIKSGGVLNNNSGGIYDIRSFGFDNRGIINNNGGTILNGGESENKPGGIINNNDGTIHNLSLGDLINEFGATINNKGFLTNAEEGIFVNPGNIINCGIYVGPQPSGNAITPCKPSPAVDGHTSASASDSGSNEILVGSSAGTTQRGIIEFDITDMPEINSVILELNVVTTDASHQTDICSYSGDGVLDLSDFNAACTLVVSGNPMMQTAGPVSIDVTTEVQNFITSGDDFVAFRLSETTEAPNRQGSLSSSGTIDGPILSFDILDGILDATADNNSEQPGPGSDTGDQVVILFTDSTNAFPINCGNIDTVLVLDNSHTWGCGASTTAVYSTTFQADDTLTITLDSSGSPDVAVGDVITIPPSTIVVGGDSNTSGATIMGTFNGPTTYFVEQSTGNDSCSLSKENNLAQTFLTIQGAFDCIVANHSGDITGLEPFEILVLDSSTYPEEVDLIGLVTTDVDTLTISSDIGQMPVIDGQNTRGTGFDVRIDNVIIDGFYIQNFQGTYASGIQIDGNSNIEIKNNIIDAQSDFAILIGFRYSAPAHQPSNDVTIHNNILMNAINEGADPNSQGITVLILGGPANLQIENNVFYAFQNDAIFFIDDFLGLVSFNTNIKNNIFYPTVSSTTIINVADPDAQSTISSDHNIFYLTGNPASANAGFWDTATQAGLSNWQASSSLDANSIDADPLFRTMGTDFHLQSMAGVWNGVDFSELSGSDSPAIDTGDPSFPFGNEPSPNGNVINIGAYGNTAEASLSPSTDSDGDGFDSTVDCDDSDNTVFPGAPELDDGKDNDCDTDIDEGLDTDGDGFTPIFGADCDDSDNTVFPGAPELIDGKDNDCDGMIDEVDDSDGDGVPDNADNCPNDSNTGQEDLDDDGTGDACDTLNIITVDTIVSSDFTSLGNLIVQGNSHFTINSGVTVTILSGNNITIQSGSGVLIKSGGTLQIDS